MTHHSKLPNLAQHSALKCVFYTSTLNLFLLTITVIFHFSAASFYFCFKLQNVSRPPWWSTYISKASRLAAWLSLDLSLLYYDSSFYWKFWWRNCKCRKWDTGLPRGLRKATVREWASFSLSLSFLRALFPLSSVSHPRSPLPKLCVNHSQTKHRQPSRPARHASTNRERKASRPNTLLTGRQNSLR